MNPIKAWNLYRKAKKVADLIETGNTKKLWQSKTFWVNLLGGILEVGQLVLDMKLLPPGVITIALAVVNIALRTITDTGIAPLKGTEK